MKKITFFKNPLFFIIIFFAFSSVITIFYYIDILLNNLPLTSNFYIALSLDIIAFIMIFLFSRIKLNSVYSYKAIIEKIQKKGVEHFRFIDDFPEHDEFGNLGHYLNLFMKTLKEFDRMKVERILLERRKVNFLLEQINTPILIFNSELKVLSMNNQFIKDFKLKDKRNFVNYNLNSIFKGEEFEQLIKRIKNNEILLVNGKNKFDINCMIGENTFNLVIQIDRISSPDDSMIDYILQILKKHRKIFHK